MQTNDELNLAIERLRKIKIAINNIKKVYHNIDSDLGIKKDVKKMINLLDKIYTELFENSNKLKLFKMYDDFYLPTICNIIEKYNNYIQKKIKSSDAEDLLKKIEQTIKKLNTHFEKKYNSLFEHEIINLDAEINVLLLEL